ncbi:uncharacterized protein LOC110605132 [Manihot esculenta]|uniref:DUF7950 domain-containing protein n=1 Tax=Manihot esculenta TaxID=3983 RepID=A0A2C9U6X5_MANES|nr:uncharacterized protein LOC110605132 [Manihot esculenta]OAY25587.1 hypothetical protein MANES_17G106700v8 [Manihot esculenta]
MDGGEERWRLLRCAGGGQDKTIINQIMLRFRPIAPKPASGAPDADNSSFNNKKLLLSTRRTKRKYVRVSKNNRLIKRNQKFSSSDQGNKEKEIDHGGFDKVVTLQLLPERSDQLKKSPERGRSWCNIDLTEKLFHDPENNNNNQAASMRLKLKQPVIDGVDQTVAMVPKRREVVVSWVTVESVTDTYGCTEGRGLGCTDMERVKNLDEDTRPGFISDGSNRVWWVNGAYKRMVSVMEEEKESESVEIMVCLVTKEKLVPYMYCCVFTCWVRLQYAWKEEKWWSQIVPCDVWRMDCGGFAWRLDVEAALGLGR